MNEYSKGLRVYADDDDERNRFLTLAMGECWHDFDTGCPVLTCKGGGFICGTCRDFVIANNDFGTEEDFTKLWAWVQSVPAVHEWVGQKSQSSLPSDPAGRRAFADELYQLLKKS